MTLGRARLSQYGTRVSALWVRQRGEMGWLQEEIPEQVCRWNRQSETCTSLILLNIGASLGHSQEKLNAKRSVPSLHIRHKVFLVLLLIRNTVSLRRGKKLQIKVKITLVPFSGISKWRAWMILSLAYAVKTGYQTGRLGTMQGHPETTRNLQWFLFNFHPTSCYKPITFL